MSAMPSRPASHRGETASRNAFTAACPAAWVVRRIEDEYGIDLEVEIFDGDRATGLTFKVQLKSKDIARGRAVSKSVKVSSLNYWLNHDVPVLVVLYDTRTGTLYGSWAHAHDTGSIPDGAKTTTFSFSYLDILDADAFARIDADVRVIRSLKDAFAPRPTPVRCLFADNVAEGARPHLLRAIKTAVDESDGELAYVPNADYAVTVRVQPDRIVAELPTRKATVTLHASAAELASDSTARRFASEGVICGIALLFQSIGLRSRAVDVLDAILPTAIVYADPGISSRVAGLLLDGRRPDLAVRVITQSPVDADPFFLLPFLMAAEMHYSRLTDEERSRLKTFFTDRAAAREAAGDEREAAIAHYSLSQLARAELDYATAIEELRETVRLDPRYVDRPYFHRELAGSYWETGEYEEAAAGYKLALELGASTEEVVHLYVDALFWAGRYDDARAARREAGTNYRLALLDDVAAAYIIDFLGVNGQRRAGDPRSDVDLQDAEQALTYLRDSDALCVSAWHRALDATPNPALSMLVMALALVSDGWTWASAVALGTLQGLDDAVIDAMIESGLHFDRVRFLDAVEELSRLQGIEGPELSALLERITERDVATPSPEPEPFLLRVHGGEGGMDVFQVR
jgi:tetratricopeptide (TPR) repeat protein